MNYKSKSTFQEGLVMDFSPDNSSSDSLTSALNATLLTYNGNELCLLNDMGNGRVETAYLPEGYIPVGTCEFGDIIYIVSYNPITNKSLIGCFPSPERNISSEEVGNLKLLFNSSDFLELNEEGEPTGKLKNTSIKKIIYEKNLNPGDKYIIYTKDSFPENATDVGNTSHIYAAFPKLFKVHVVAIDDSGKMTYLDSTVKWYDITSNRKRLDYFINVGKDNSLNEPDIDSYRNLISSGYSIYQSKIAGKLALLIELEKITGFSCTTDIYTVSKDSTTPDSSDNSYFNQKNYAVYFNINWSTLNNNINPNGLVLLDSKWAGKDLTKKGLFFYPKYDSNTNEYIIDYTKKGTDIVSYNSNNWKPTFNNQENGLYWNTEISRCYKPENLISYDNFINLESYDKKLETFITDIIDNLLVYKDISLNKISIKRDENGFPKKDSNNEYQYYINAQFINNSTESADKIYYTTDITGTLREIKPVSISDDIVNNYFKYGVYKEFNTFSIPIEYVYKGETILKTDISNLIYLYKIAPSMPYGILEELSLEGYIDFSKIQSGEIKLNTWKYYNSNDLSTLNLGLEVYPENNKGVSEVVLEFYDNQGIAAAYHLTGKSSYSGQFIEYITFNNSGTNYKLNNLDCSNNEILHAGVQSSLEGTNLVYKTVEGRNKVKCYKIYTKDDKHYYKNSNGDEIEVIDTTKVFNNDAGILYSDILYLVKIVVKYCSKNSLGLYNTDDIKDYKYFYRWYWTNDLFNDYYTSTTDFDTLLGVLDLDIISNYTSTNRWELIEKDYSSTSKAESGYYVNTFATVLSINLGNNIEGNMKAHIDIGLLNTYNTFSLAYNIDGVSCTDRYNLDLVLGKSYITNSDSTIINNGNKLDGENYTLLFPSYEEELLYTPPYAEDLTPDYDYGGIMPAMSTNLASLLGVGRANLIPDLWEDSENYKENYKNRYSINFLRGPEVKLINESFTYLSSDGLETITIPKYLKWDTSNLDLKLLNGIELTFTGIHFSKYKRSNQTKLVSLPTIVPLINTKLDLATYGMALDENNTPYFTLVVGIGNRFEQVDGNRNDRVHIGATIYNSPGLSFTLANTSLSGIACEYDLYSYNDTHISISKNAYNNYTEARLWEKPFDNGKYFKELFNGLLGLIMYCSRPNSTTDPNKSRIVFFGGSHATERNKGIYPTSMWNSMFKVPNLMDMGDKNNETKGFVRVPNYMLNNNSVLEGESVDENTTRAYACLMGLAIKTKNGSIRALSNLFPTSYIKGLASQVIRYNFNSKVSPNPNYYYPSTVGEAVCLILSNMYIYKPDTINVTVPDSEVLYYLTNNNSCFKKDIIYTLSTSSDSSYGDSDVILLKGMLLKSYILCIKNNCNGSYLSNDFNVYIKLNSVLKNIPILINFLYKNPYETVLVDLKYTAALRLSYNNYYIPITGTFSENTLYLYNRDKGEILEQYSYDANGGDPVLSIYDTITYDKNTDLLIYNLEKIRPTEKFYRFTINNGLLTTSVDNIAFTEGLNMWSGDDNNSEGFIAYLYGISSVDFLGNVGYVGSSY